MRQLAVICVVVSSWIGSGLLAPYQALGNHAIEGVEVLHRFASGPDEGTGPQGGLVLDGSTFYGTSAHHRCFGGCDDSEIDYEFGSVYSINVDGSGFTQLHDFVGGEDDGLYPLARPTLIGSTLYGTTWKGGDLNEGTIYSINTDGSEFSLLHEFDGDDGRLPRGNLISIGSTLYGMAASSSSGRGTLFSMETDGSNFTVLHEFRGGIGDGAFPYSGLILDGSTFYGTTSGGGFRNKGTLFSIETDGSNFSVLHEFNGTDGSLPQTNLTKYGSKLYGTSTLGGINDHGTIFSIETNGNSFELLHEFAGEPIGGSKPAGELFISDFEIFGTTRRGGDTGHGTVYSIGLDGDDFALLHQFRGTGDPQNGLRDGSQPRANLIKIGSSLFTATTRGGENNFGTIAEIILSLHSDFDGNNKVDEQDLETWAAGFGMQSIAPKSSGNSDVDGDVDGSDFLAWQRGLGLSLETVEFDADFGGDQAVNALDLMQWSAGFGAHTVVPKSEGNADANEWVDGADFMAWQRTFGLASETEVFAADFDDNQAVDSQDLARWTDNFGTLSVLPKSEGNADSDGDVDGLDFLEWQRGFGLSLTTVAFDADFGGDQAVSGEDLALWANGFGTQTDVSISVGDGNDDGNVDGADFLEWQREFGLSPANQPSTNTAIPEPSSLALVFVSVMLCLTKRRIHPESGTRPQSRIEPLQTVLHWHNCWLILYKRSV